MAQPVLTYRYVWSQSPALLWKQAACPWIQPTTPCPITDRQTDRHTHTHTQIYLSILYLFEIHKVYFKEDSGGVRCGGSMKTTVRHHAAFLCLNFLHTLIWPWSETGRHAKRSNYKKAWPCPKRGLLIHFPPFCDLLTATKMTWG